MEIYFYVLIAAVYLILGFVSADGGLPGIGKMASFIYEKTGGILRGRKAGRFLRENGLRRDLAILYPFGRTQQEARRFYIERIRIVLLILLAGDILAIAGYASAGMDQLLTEHNKLVRDEIGGEDRSTQVEVSVLPKAHSEDGTAGKEDTVYRGNYRLEVRSRKYDQGQAGVLADRLFKILPERILGKNSDLGHVTSRLFLPEEVEGFPFSIAWESSSYALVDSDGMVGNLAMGEKERRETTITAVLTYDNGTAEGLRFEKEYPVTVFPPALTQEEKLSAQIEEALRAADEKSVSDSFFPLPEASDDLTFYWEEKPSDPGAALMLFAAAVSGLATAAMGSRLHQKVVDRERQLMLDYPQIISKFVLYLGAGLSIRSTFIKIGEDYSRKKEEGGGSRGAYEEVLLVSRELMSGVPEAEAYARFGQRCRSRQYTRLCTLLTQNIRKGNKELLSVMQQEAQASFEERRSTARKLGEEAETKLLLPMVLMLAITMLIIIIPAYYSFAA